MKLRTTIKALLICSLSLGIVSCANQNQLGSYYNTETTCEGSAFNGNQFVLAWGKGYSKDEAIEQAKKEALNTVLFKGIQKGKQGCQINPIVTEVNARDRHAGYFDYFFSNANVYSQFITVVTKGNKQVEQKNDKEIKIGIVFDIDMTSLRNKLINDNILKQ